MEKKHFPKFLRFNWGLASQKIHAKAFSETKCFILEFCKLKMRTCLEFIEKIP